VIGGAMSVATVNAMPLIRSSLCFAVCCTALLARPLAATPAPDARLTDWSKIENDLHGFSIAYPGSVFQPKEVETAAEGRVLVSRDGNARMLVGAFGNDERLSLTAYRDYLLQQNYAKASIDYAPVRRSWFVLSGERDGVMFYERVSFTCGGRLITSWGMFYPVAERRFYDRVVEAVAPTFNPGRRNGDCN
jgi:hypothetical protein